MSESTVMSIRISAALHRKLARIAKLERRSNSWMGAEAIKEFVQLREAHLAEIEEGVRSFETEPTHTLDEVRAVLRSARARK